MFYFERYNNHERAQKHAKNLRPVIEGKIEMLNRIKSYPMNELEFMVEAVEEVIKCRHVLKWTYAFGYCLDESKVAEKNLFENLQE